MSIKVKNLVYYVGYVDWNIRDFHGYQTNRGSSYNSFLINDEKKVIVDSVKSAYSDRFIENIKEVCDLKDIDYVICNHAEPDHSGSIPALMRLCPQAEVVCNAKCKDILNKHYDTSGWNYKVVDEETTLSLGKYSLKFINTPMAHWPESMFTYIPEEKILFTMDAFGQHYASSKMFDDEIPLAEAMYEAKTYYANIVMLYGNQVEKILKKADSIDIELMLPSHGIFWRKNIGDIVEQYKKWMKCKSEPKVLIFFDTMWQSTQRMAEAIYKGANLHGVRVKMFDLKSTDITQLATEALDSAAYAVGSPTLNKGLMPKVAEALTYLRGLAPKDKTAICFGSYGWAKKGGPHEILKYLEDMNCNILLDEPIQAQFSPTEEVLEKCFKAGELLAIEAQKYCNS